MKNSTLVAIPAYNEEDCIEATITELKEIAPDFDFVVINDGSSDGTLKTLSKLGCTYIDLPINCGLTIGFQTAAKYALSNGYTGMIQFDADGQHRPEFLKQLVAEHNRSNADIVIGSRFRNKPKDSSLRMIGSRLITWLIKLMTGTTISDPTSGFRYFNRKTLDVIANDSTLNPEPETLALLARKGYQIQEVQVDMRERQGGESYLNFARSISYMARVFVSILFVQWIR